MVLEEDGTEVGLPFFVQQFICMISTWAGFLTLTLKVLRVGKLYRGQHGPRRGIFDSLFLCSS